MFLYHKHIMLPDLECKKPDESASRKKRQNWEGVGRSEATSPEIGYDLKHF